MNNAPLEDCRELAAQKYMIFVALNNARRLENSRLSAADRREMARELRQAAGHLEGETCGRHNPAGTKLMKTIQTPRAKK